MAWTVPWTETSTSSTAATTGKEPVHEHPSSSSSSSEEEEEETDSSSSEGDDNARANNNNNNNNNETSENSQQPILAVPTKQHSSDEEAVEDEAENNKHGSVHDVAETSLTTALTSTNASTATSGTTTQNTTTVTTTTATTADTPIMTSEPSLLTPPSSSSSSWWPLRSSSGKAQTCTDGDTETPKPEIISACLNGTGGSSSNNHNTAHKVEEMVDLWELRHLSITKRGLVQSTFRQRAWPKLLAVHESMDATAAAAVAAAAAAATDESPNTLTTTSSTSSFLSTVPDDETWVRTLCQKDTVWNITEYLQQQEQEQFNQQWQEQMEDAAAAAGDNKMDRLKLKRKVSFDLDQKEPGRNGDQEEEEGNNRRSESPVSLTSYESADEQDTSRCNLFGFGGGHPHHPPAATLPVPSSASTSGVTSAMEAAGSYLAAMASAWAVSPRKQEGDTPERPELQRSSSNSSFTSCLSATITYPPSALPPTRRSTTLRKSASRIRHQQERDILANIILHVLRLNPPPAECNKNEKNIETLSLQQEGTEKPEMAGDQLRRYHPYPGIQNVAAMLLMQLKSPSLASLVLGQLASYQLQPYFLKHHYATTNRDNPTTAPFQQEEEDDDDFAYMTLLEHVDPLVHQCIVVASEALGGDGKMTPWFIKKSWRPSWFANDIVDASIVARLWDVLMVSHPLCSVYISVAITVQFQTHLIAANDLSKESVIPTLQGLVGPKGPLLTNDNPMEVVEEILALTLEYMDQVPPPMLMKGENEPTNPTFGGDQNIAVTPLWATAAKAPTDYALLHKAKKLRATTSTAGQPLENDITIKERSLGVENEPPSNNNGMEENQEKDTAKSAETPGDSNTNTSAARFPQAAIAAGVLPVDNAQGRHQHGHSKCCLFMSMLVAFVVAYLAASSIIAANDRIIQQEEMKLFMQDRELKHARWKKDWESARQAEVGDTGKDKKGAHMLQTKDAQRAVPSGARMREEQLKKEHEREIKHKQWQSSWRDVREDEASQKEREAADKRFAEEEEDKRRLEERIEMAKKATQVAAKAAAAERLKQQEERSRFFKDELRKEHERREKEAGGKEKEPEQRDRLPVGDDAIRLAELSSEKTKQAKEEAERFVAENQPTGDDEEAEEARIEAEQRAAEEARRLKEEEAPKLEQQRQAEQARIKAEQRAAEEARRLKEEEAARVEQQRQAEAEQRAAEEARRLKEEEAARVEQQAQKEAEQRAAEESRRLKEEEAAAAEQQRLAEQAQKQAEQRAAEEARRLKEEEAAAAEQQRLAEQAQKQAEQRAAEEARRLEEEAAAAEQQRLAEQAQKQAEQRAAEETRRLKEEEAAREEQKRQAEQAQKQAEQRAAEEARRLKEEEAAAAEQQRLAKQAQKEAEHRAAEEARRLKEEAEEGHKETAMNKQGQLASSKDARHPTEILAAHQETKEQMKRFWGDPNILDLEVTGNKAAEGKPKRGILGRLFGRKKQNKANDSIQEPPADKKDEVQKENPKVPVHKKLGRGLGAYWKRIRASG